MHVGPQSLTGYIGLLATLRIWQLQFFVSFIKNFKLNMLSNKWQLYYYQHGRASVMVGTAHSTAHDAQSRLQATIIVAVAVMVAATVECGLPGSSSGPPK